MKIGKLEWGIATVAGKSAWKDLYFYMGKSSCNCYMLDIWFFYITWLSDECYHPCSDPECKCHED